MGKTICDIIQTKEGIDIHKGASQNVQGNELMIAFKEWYYEIILKKTVIQLLLI